VRTRRVKAEVAVGGGVAETRATVELPAARP
jgi:hypothetical protein